jgi:hypothetical protein
MNFYIPEVVEKEKIPNSKKELKSGKKIQK